MWLKETQICIQDLGPTSCWDIAAAHAIVTSAGGFVLDPEGITLNYDIIENILNPYFLVAADDRWTKNWIKQNNNTN